MGFSALDGLMMATRPGSLDPGVAAQEALDLFLHRLLAEVGAFAAVAGGLDGIVFTAGVGEHGAVLRVACCERLSWLGVRLDRDCNAAAGRVASTITAGDSAVRAWVIPTDEEAVIARHTRKVLRPGG